MVPVLEAKESLFPLLFTFIFYLFFLPGGILVCSQHLGQGLGSVWLHLKHKGKHLVLLL